MYPFSLKLALVAILSLAVTARAFVTPRATTCNGHPELCSRLYSNVTFVGAHDSYAVGVDNLSTNQDQNVTTQLRDGIRMLQVQVHNNNGVLALCHTSCILYNGGPLQDYLTKVKTWMSQNPNDVVTLLMVNNDNVAPSVYDTVFKAAGIDTLAYAPSSASLTLSQWPTMGSLIDAGKRLVVFMDSTADFTSVPYIISEFLSIWETAFDVTDTTFNCNVNRTLAQDTTTQMYLINHFLDQLVNGQPAPSVQQADTTNAASGTGSLGLQVQTCATQNGRYPNFMLVDFYEFGGGSVFQVAATANGVAYSPSQPIAKPVSTSMSASGAAQPGMVGNSPLVTLLALLFGVAGLI